MQDMVGFPHFLPTCYWYMVGGEEKAIKFVSTGDIGADAASLESQEYIYYVNVYIIYTTICDRI